MLKQLIRQIDTAVLGTGLLLWLSLAQAQDLDPAVNTEAGINAAAAASQKRVDSLTRETEDLLTEYRVIVREVESLQTYNANLEKVIEDQRKEIRSINAQIGGLEETNRDIVPLMLEMIATLGQIVEADIPFHIDERRARVSRLSDMMEQADITLSEKFRRVMESYQGELQYGRTTEAYSAVLPTSGQTVDFLRVGRTLLIYQTGDQSETGWFNPVSREFEPLPGLYQQEVKNGIAIARNEKAPNLVMLPVPGPEAAE